MDRQIIYIGQIPQDTDMLLTNKNSFIGLAKLAAAILGINTSINAFTCVPTAPASMQVKVTPGEIYSLENIDNNAYGSLAADTSHSILKQGVILDDTTLTLTAPGTVGNSWNILIQIGFSETDGGSTVLPYYNASDPQVPWSGPNNSGQPNNTIRFDGVTIQAKTGVQAPTGTQVTPSPDTGFVGAFVVTVANGQSSITSGNISTYSGAPFITETLTQKISQATADLRYGQITAIQNGQYLYGVDTGTVNALAATLSPAIGSYSAGMTVFIKVANTNTGASTLNLNGLGIKNIVSGNGGALNSGTLVAGGIAIFTYDGTNFQLTSSTDISVVSIQNNSFIYAADSGTANTYVAAPSPALSSYNAGLGLIVKISNPNTGASTLNVNGLGAKNIVLTNGNTPNSNDLVAGMEAWFIYDGTNFQLMNPTMEYLFLGLATYASSSSTPNIYTATLSPAPVSYVAGEKITIKFTNANTGAATLNLNSLGAITLVRPDGTALQAGDIAAGMMADLRYDGTNFQLLNPNVAIRTVGVAHILSSQSWTPPAGFLYGDVEIVASGGSGSGATSGASQTGTGSGGAAGAYALRRCTASDIGASISITIGAAVTGGTGGTAGVSGNTTSFGSLFSCSGGAGGAVINSFSTYSFNSGVNGGTATGGDFSIRGGQSGNGMGFGSSAIGVGGTGGNSYFGPGGRAGIGGNGVGGNGSPGEGYGSGGGGGATGGASNATGGDSAQGYCRITYYCTV